MTTDEEQKKREWEAFPAPTTPLEKSIYVDSCNDWILRPAGSVSEGRCVVTSKASCGRQEWIPNLSLSYEHCRPRYKSSCVSCGKEGGICPEELMLLNPYSHSPYCYVCKGCKEGVITNEV